MPDTAVGSTKNILVNTFKLEFDAQDMGEVLLGEVAWPREIYELMNGNSGNPLDRLGLAKPVTVKATLTEIIVETLEKLWGVASTNVGAGTADIVDELVAVSGKYVDGDWADLAHGQGYESPITAVSVKDAADAACALYTDYVMDYNNGRIARIDGGLIADGEIAKVTYTYVTQASKRWGLTEGVLDLEGETILTKYFPEDGKTFYLKLWKAHIISTPIVIPFALSTKSEIEIEIAACEDSTQAATEKFGYATLES